MSTTPASPPDPVTPGHVDVLIVGAGLSGIGAACHLQAEAPGTSYALVEARGASGGTWDLFRFPGVRSDSDMFTLGYPFRPWKDSRSIVGGAEILRYLRETAAAYGVDRQVSYHTRVVRADWSSPDARWTVTVEDTRSGDRTRRTCGFLYLCSGYYRYDQGYTPSWPGQDDFARHRGAPAALAGGPRRHRPAGRGHRQRRHRRHDRPGSRRDGRARDHAAALTLVRAAHPGP